VSPNKYATPLKWAVTPPGKKFLMSAQWAPDVKLGSKLYVGAACKYKRERVKFGYYNV
jgi:hypothetical protein